jgi:hypothetical protein
VYPSLRSIWKRSGGVCPLIDQSSHGVEISIGYDDPLPPCDRGVKGVTNGTKCFPCLEKRCFCCTALSNRCMHSETIFVSSTRAYKKPLRYSGYFDEQWIHRQFAAAVCEPSAEGFGLSFRRRCLIQPKSSSSRLNLRSSIGLTAAASDRAKSARLVVAAESGTRDDGAFSLHSNIGPRSALRDSNLMSCVRICAGVRGFDFQSGSAS